MQEEKSADKPTWTKPKLTPLVNLGEADATKFPGSIETLTGFPIRNVSAGVTDYGIGPSS